MADSNRRSMSLNNSQAGDVVVSSDPMSERLIADDTKDVESQQPGTEQVQPLPAWWNTVKIGALITVWYALSLGFGVYNKKTLNLIDVPWTLSTLQLCIGLFIFGPLWAFRLREFPRVSMKLVMAMFPLGVFHTLTHLAGVIGMGAGAVSSFQILKAAEPVLTCFLNVVIIQKVFRWYVYASIVPIVLGVGYSSMGSDNGMNALSVTGAMMSNLGSSLRGIYSKKFMDIRKNLMAADPDAPDDHLTPANMYALITIWAILISFPFCVWFELIEIASIWDSATEHPDVESADLIMNALFSGVFYYVYNEVAFNTLNQLHAVTHAIVNTVKRVIMILVTAAVLVEPLSLQFVIGATIGIGGVLLYSLAKQRDAKESAEAAAQQ
jgi:solute carrier family 35 protein E1